MVTNIYERQQSGREYIWSKIRALMFSMRGGPTEVGDCSLPPPNMAAIKTGEQGKAWSSVL